MSNPDEQRTSFIPPNFIEKGKILNGTFDIRNAIEAIIFALLIGVPVVHLPFSLTTRIIILCMTALPAAMVSLIGISGESIIKCQDKMYKKYGIRMYINLLVECGFATGKIFLIL